MKGTLRRWVGSLVRRVQPPSAEASYYIRLGAATAGISVHNEEGALSFTGVWACVKVIAETIAGLPWQAYRKGPDGDRQALDWHGVTQLLNVRPNPEITAFLWRERMVAWAALWGDAYAEIERDAIGRPVALWQLEPHRVQLERDDAGALVYRVRNPGAEDTYLSPDEMLHIRGLGPTGLCGYYVVALFRECIALGLATEQQAAAYFGNAASPSGVLTHPGRIDPEQARELVETFEQRHLGPTKRHRVGILQGGLDYKAIGNTAEDAQLEKTRTFQILEACRIFRVPPHKIAELSRATFSNIAEQETAFGRDCISPWAKRFEQEADAKLFVARPSQLFYSRMNVNAIMRGDPKGRAEFYEIMQRLGVLTVNEIRAWEEMNAIGPEGDKRLVTANFTTLERIGQEVVGWNGPGSDGRDGRDGQGQEEDERGEKTEGNGGAEGEGAGGGEGHPEGARRQAQELARAYRAVRGMVRDLTAWLSRRSRGALAAAAKRYALASAQGDQDAFRAWMVEYTADTADLLTGRLRPLLAAWCELADLPENLAPEAAGRIGYTLAVAIQNATGPGEPWAEARLEALGPAWAGRMTDWIMGQLAQLTMEGCGHGGRD